MSGRRSDCMNSIN